MFSPLRYLVIKALEPGETEAFIVIQCLIKDVNSKSDCNRANAIRVLSKILDQSVANQVADRYLKTAIVDKNSFVASSSLACGKLEKLEKLSRRNLRNLRFVENSYDFLQEPLIIPLFPISILPRNHPRPPYS